MLYSPIVLSMVDFSPKCVPWQEQCLTTRHWSHQVVSTVARAMNEVTIGFRHTPAGWPVVETPPLASWNV